jgi:uncharacterized protein YjaZ
MQTRFIVPLIAVALASANALARGNGAHSSSGAQAGPAIHTEDVERFYAICDAAGGKPDAEVLQRDYLDKGSEGLHELAKARNVTGARIADTLAKRPELYADARRCLAVLPKVRARVDTALHSLVERYPQARVPAVTIAVGRGKPVGVGSPAGGLQIGLEALCATNWLNPDVEERFVHVIVHEYVHVQQNEALSEAEHPTVLERSLMEGAAEFVAEQTSGQVAYSRLAASTRGREHAIESAFAADIDKTDLSQWFDNSTIEKPGDLGYWVGYRIVRAYYEHAPDKRRALREIIELDDAKAFLTDSGWSPQAVQVH